MSAISNIGAEIVDEGDPRSWYLAFFHEAGHAIAANHCGRTVNDIYIDPSNGYTSHGSFDQEYQHDDRQFIMWAGTWAEVRALWAFYDVATSEEVDARSFAQMAREFLRKNDSDWLEYHQAVGRDYGQRERQQASAAYYGTASPPIEQPPNEEWNERLEEVWPLMRLLGLSMLKGDSQINVGQDQLVRVQRGRWLRPLP